MRRRRRAGLLSCVAALALALLPAGTSTAAPGGSGSTGTSARPTADPAAPTPTAPITGLPPRGTAPDGSTVGGGELDARGVVVADGAPPLPPDLAASAWLVADAGTGTVLAARDPHGRHYPASTLKTLTVLTLLHRLDPAEVVVATEDDERMEGSRVGLVTGGRYPVRLLFEALVLQSGNDAANALARAAGGVERTVAAMNATAEALGAYDTVAGSPSGLDVAGQTTSAYDLALIFRALLEDPAAAALLRTPVAQMPPVEGRSAGYQIQNQNPLHGYPGGLGGKTGFTDAARHTFVTAAERDGRRLLVSVLDTEDEPLRAACQAALLLDWGFAVPAGGEGVGRLVRPEDLRTPSGTASSAPTSGSRSPVGTAADAAEATSGGRWPLLLGLVLAGALLLSALLVLARRPGGRPG